MKFPLFAKNTTADVIAPLAKILDDLESLIQQNDAKYDNEAIAIAEAKLRMDAYSRESFKAGRIAKNLQDMLA